MQVQALRSWLCPIHSGTCHHTEEKSNSLKAPALTPQSLAPSSSRIAAIFEPGRSLSLQTTLALVTPVPAPHPSKEMAASITREEATCIHFRSSSSTKNHWEHTDCTGTLPMQRHSLMTEIGTSFT